MIQILLIHNPLVLYKPSTYLSYLIRKVTKSHWNHVAIRVNDVVIEAVGKGVILTKYENWVNRTKRDVLPMYVPYDVDISKILSLEGEPYGHLDLLIYGLELIGIVKSAGNYRGYLCSELGCILINESKLMYPGEFEHHPSLIRGEIYKT